MIFDLFCKRVDFIYIFSRRKCSPTCAWAHFRLRWNLIIFFFYLVNQYYMIYSYTNIMYYNILIWKLQKCFWRTLVFKRFSRLFNHIIIIMYNTTAKTLKLKYRPVRQLVDVIRFPYRLFYENPRAWTNMHNIIVSRK